MGKPKVFAISLSGNNTVYYAGSHVEGSVILDLTEPKNAQEISIVFSGKAYVQWIEERSSGNAVDYSDTEIIVNDEFIQLWGNGKDSQELAAGQHEFPFKFELPSNCVLPTSFESPASGYQAPVGYIRYSLLARIRRSWKFDHTTTRAITVNEIVDINTAQLTTPLSSSNEKTLCCLCCTSGPLSLSVQTDRGGYCPGESIAISTEGENHSNRRVTSVRATLKQVVSYYARGRRHESSKIIKRIEGRGIYPGASSNWSNKLLSIPVIAPSINSCRILKLSYVLTVTFGIPNAIDLHVTIPIIIGNVPFRGGESSPVSFNIATAPYPPPAGTDPYPPVGSSDASFNYSTAYPPVNIGIDNYTMGETRFAPPTSAVVKAQGGEN